jgi:DNA polymerase III epsilon subunit-like protein
MEEEEEEEDILDNGVNRHNIYSQTTQTHGINKGIIQKEKEIEEVIHNTEIILNNNRVVTQTQVNHGNTILNTIQHQENSGQATSTIVDTETSADKMISK